MESATTLLEALSGLVVELETSSRRPTREVWKLASRGMALRRRATEATQRLAQREGRSADVRRTLARLEALSVALTTVLRSYGAEGMATTEERERLVDWSQSGRSDELDTMSSLTRSRDMLAAGLEHIASAHTAVDQDEAALRGVETYHARIERAMRAARHLIREMTHREQREKLAMRASIGVFYGVVVYIVYRRFPLRSLLEYAGRAVWGLLTRTTTTS